MRKKTHKLDVRVVGKIEDLKEKKIQFIFLNYHKSLIFSTTKLDNRGRPTVQTR